MDDKLQPMDAPQQVVFIVIEPKTKSGQEKLAHGLRKLMAEDPTFRIDSDVATGRTIVRGIDELQLDMIVDRLTDEFNVEATVGEPQAAYKQTLTQMADGEGRYIKQTGGQANTATSRSGGAAASGQRIRIRQRRHRRPHTEVIYQSDGSRHQGSA